MPRKPPKRRRSVAFPDQEDAQESIAEDSGGPDKPIDITDNAEDQPVPPLEGEEETPLDAPVVSEKELEIWESFREEQFEVLEQLPLSLHREFALILELDQQVSDYNNALHSAARKYIAKRRAIAARYRKESGQSMQTDSNEQAHGSINTSEDQPLASTSTQHQAESQNTVDEPMSQDPPEDPPETIADSSQLTFSTESQESSQPQHQPTPPPPEPEEEPPETNRQLLTTIAQMSEGIVRASSEKVNVARHAYDLVDRYIRDLDRAIKEEETSLLVGLRPGTHPASIILPEVVVPSLKAHRRITSSPVPEDLPPGLVPGSDPPDQDVVMADETTVNVNANANVSTKPPSKRKSSRTRERRDISGSTSIGRDDDTPPTAAVTRKVRLTLRPQDDTEEEKWCFCHQGSYGNMIACDNKTCKLEWFHFGCAGLAEDYQPKGKWYCRDCAPLIQKKGKTR